MKKILILLSAALLMAAMAIPALAEFPLEDLTLPEEGLHFGFNGDARDDSGAVVGELVGDPTFVEGRDGTANGAVYLDDNEQYILLGKYVDAENYTASFWAKVEDNTEHVFLCSSILGSIRIIHDGGVYVGSTINGVVDNVSGYAAPRDEWVNLTFVYTGEAETMDIYANGEFQDTVTGALPLPLTLIGNEATEQKGWQSYPFLTLDDAWFFPKAFTADEVKAFYENGSAGGNAGAEDGLITFKTNTDKEQDYIYFEMNSNFSGDSRYHDGAGFIIYEFPCPQDAKNASLTWKIQAQYQVSVTNTDPDDDDAFEIIDENQPTQGEIDAGKADWGYSNGVQIPTYDLSKWCENNQTGKIWVKMADADPANGWGGFIFSDFPITYYAGTAPAPEIQKPKTTSELQEEALAKIGTDGQSFVVHTDTEEPYMIDEYNSGNDNGARFMDGLAYVVYEFTVNPGDKYAGIEWVLNNQYLIEVNNTDPDDESAWETFIEAEQNDDEMESGSPDWGNRRFVMTPDLDKEDENYKTSLYIYRYDLSEWCENNTTGKIWIRMGDCDPDTGGWGGYISGLYPVTFKSGAEPITWAASGYPVWGTDIVETISDTESSDTAEETPADPNAPSILWDFNADQAMDADMGANSGPNTVSWTGEKDADGNEYYVFTASGPDPYVSVDLSAADVSDVLWAKARVKNAGPALAIELYGATDGRGLAGPECTHIDVGSDGEWHTYLISVPEENVKTANAFKGADLSETYWSGAVNWIRLDPMWIEGDGATADGDQIMIDYIAFFPTKEAAEAFRSELDSEYAASSGFASVEDAAAGKNVVTGYEFISGTDSFGGEGPENLWDGETSTKFCTNVFPAESVVKLDGTYNITGFTMATANDNADYNGRSPNAWTISVSADGENWTELASGDDTFFEETNFTYYAGEGEAEGVSYVKFSAEGTASGTFQVSELTVFGDKAAEPVDEKLDRKAEAPNTFDFGVAAALAAVISLGGFAASRKKR